MVIRLVQKIWQVEIFEEHFSRSTGLKLASFTELIFGIRKFILNLAALVFAHDL